MDPIKKKVNETATVIRDWLAGPANPTIVEHRQSIERMMEGLWARQTEDEQATKTTKNRNGRGFNAQDAEFAGNFITYLRKHGRCDDRLGWMARRKLMKYSRQLAEIKVARDMDSGK